MKRMKDLINLDDHREANLPERTVADPRTFQRVVVATFQKQKSKIMRLYQLLAELMQSIEANTTRIEALEKRVGEIANKDASGRRIIMPGE